MTHRGSESPIQYTMHNARLSELPCGSSFHAPLKTFGSTAVFPPGSVAVGFIGESAGAGDASESALKSASCGMNGLRITLAESVV